ncbi:MAG TPA: sulfatase-like hydrolase/transferase, partial [Vicinamibacteria bacterium]|nr:sulfatase-like hydrolase/transferase [Vicinamibacteria bacterium]
RQWAVPGKPLGWYVARYDGEIAAVDAEVGQLLDVLDASAVRDRTLVVITSDHGESLGEHEYYFDHGEDLFDPSIRIPLIVAGPGIEAGGRSEVLATTLDLVPTVLDAVKVSYPPDLAGQSLLPAARGERRPDRRRLQGQNDRNLLAAWDRRFKVVATPSGEGARYALYERETDPGETRDVSGDRAGQARNERRELELFRERIDAQRAKTRRLLEGRSGEERLSVEACEKLKAMGYVQQGCS